MELIFFLCLGPLGLLVVIINHYKNKKERILMENTSYYGLGVVFFVISSLISPCIPVYLIHEWSKSVGSGSGLIFLIILPFSVLAFIIGLIFFGINNKRKKLTSR